MAGPKSKQQKAKAVAITDIEEPFFDDNWSDIVKEENDSGTNKEQKKKGKKRKKDRDADASASSQPAKKRKEANIHNKKHGGKDGTKVSR